MQHRIAMPHIFSRRSSPRKGLATAWAIVLVLFFTSRAQADDKTMDLATGRFQRAVTLNRNGDINAALAEFQRVQELTPHPVVRFNIGVLQAELGRFAEAEESLEAVITQAPASLSPESLTVAREKLSAARERVGEVAITVSVEGAQIEVDGVVVAKAPLARPLRLTTGSHVVGALAEGHAPVRKAVTIAAGARAAVELAPPAFEGRLAHLLVSSNVPDASLFVDGDPAARTPLDATLTLRPGTHTLRLERDGYFSERRTISLGEGASGEVAFPLEEDPEVIRLRGGNLTLILSETLVEVTVDGRSRGVYTEPLRLAAGLHHLHIERAQFKPIDRDVWIEPGRHVEVKLHLEPTPAMRLSWNDRVERQSSAVLGTLLPGVALTAAAGVFLSWNHGNKAARQRELDDALGECRTDSSDCKILSQREAAVNLALTLDVVGAIGMGIGGVGILTGVLLLARREDPSRYGKKPVERLQMLPSLTVGRHGGSLGLTGRF